MLSNYKIRWIHAVGLLLALATIKTTPMTRTMVQPRLIDTKSLEACATIPPVIFRDPSTKTLNYIHLVMPSYISSIEMSQNNLETTGWISTMLTQRESKQCILTINGIVRPVPRAYRSHIEHINAKNQGSTNSLPLEDNLDTAGIILHGQAGVGKTELADFFAEVANTPSASIDLSKIISPYQGATAANIHKVFEDARQKARDSHMAVILIFEHIDRIADYDFMDYNSEYEEAYQQFCHEADQSKKDGDIFIVSTTNHIRLCNPEFRKKFTEITLVSPQNDNERAAALYGYLHRLLSMRAFTLEDIANFHQTTREKLSEKLHAPFDQLVHVLEQLTKKIITLEQNSSYLVFETYSQNNEKIQEIKDLSDQLNKYAVLFDPATVSEESLQKTYVNISNIIKSQVDKMGLFSDKIRLIHENIALAAHTTSGLNFRELKDLAITLLNYPEQFRKGLSPAQARCDHSSNPTTAKDTHTHQTHRGKVKIINNMSFKHPSVAAIVPILGVATFAAVGAISEGFGKGIGEGLFEKHKRKNRKKIDQESATNSELSNKDTLPEPA